MNNASIETGSPDQAAAILRHKGISPTHQRITVLKYLLSHPGHPGADEVCEATRDADPPLSKASVYNILHLFEEKNLLRAVHIDGACLRYDAITQEHGHFRCDACGTIFNFRAAVDEMAIKELNGFRIRQKDIYYRGLCADCQSLSNQNTKTI